MKHLIAFNVSDGDCFLAYLFIDFEETDVQRDETCRMLFSQGRVYFETLLAAGGRKQSG